MIKCENCVDGLVHQGESIKKTCEVCHGTGTVGGAEVASDTTTSEPVAEVDSDTTGSDESFLDDSSDDSDDSEPSEDAQ